jgi:hypothetical protein
MAGNPQTSRQLSVNILLEGADCTGKTTLANSVFKNFHRHHNGVPPWNDEKNNVADVRAWQMVNLTHKIDALCDGVLIERSWISGQVYGPVTKCKAAYTELDHRIFVRRFMSLNSILLFAIPPFEVAYTLWRERASRGEELLIHDRQYAEVYYGFLRAFENSLADFPPGTVAEYDWTQDDIEFDADNDVLRVRDQQLEPMRNPYPGFVFGNPQARLAIVFPRRSELWKATQTALMLLRAGVDERDVVWVRDFDEIHLPNVKSVLDATDYNNSTLKNVKEHRKLNWQDPAVIKEAWYAAFDS